jgi:two-component system response regulator YesN
MANKSKLSRRLSPQQFEQIKEVFGRHFQFSLETTDIRGKVVDSLSSDDFEPKFCTIVKGSATGCKRCRKQRRKSLEIAFDTGESYITICHAGIVLVCVPIMDRDETLGGVFFGKCLWEPISDALVKDIHKRHSHLQIDKNALVKALKKLPVVPGRNIHKAAQFLFDLLYEVAGLDPRVIRWRQKRTQQQAQIGEFIQENKKLGTDWRYPLENEQELLGKVKIGDRTGAKEILNSILGTILFQNPGELGILKVRMLELLSILSRAATEGGVDVEKMLKRNLAYINKVIPIDNQEDLCVWISEALNEFIEMVYSSQDAKRITQIRPALNYIDANYDKPINLTDIAKSCHLSVSRLAHIFKDQMGITVIDYLTSVRIDRAKHLLVATDQNCTEICFQVGYNNQSYFTRTFKELVGMTPREFRSSNQRKKPLSSPV